MQRNPLNHPARKQKTINTVKAVSKIDLTPTSILVVEGHVTEHEIDQMKQQLRDHLGFPVMIICGPVAVLQGP